MLNLPPLKSTAVIPVSLDSPKWRRLRTAYGSAAEIPDYLRALAAVAADSSDPWAARDNVAFELWSYIHAALDDQLTRDWAAFAVLHHLAAMAETSGLRHRIETLLLAGRLMLWSVDGPKLSRAARNALAGALGLIRPWSLEASRRACARPAYRRRGSIPLLLQAFAALRTPEVPCVRVLDVFAGPGEVGVKCPHCDDYTYQDILAHPPAVTPPADATERRKRARAALKESSDPVWRPRDAASVLSTLAASWRATRLAVVIRALDGTTRCAACGKRFVLAKGLLAA
jgi:hypothetical protein